VRASGLLVSIQTEIRRVVSDCVVVFHAFPVSPPAVVIVPGAWQAEGVSDPESLPLLLERCHALLERAERIAVLTGAGISTDSGIPDFRGPNGIWTKDPKAEKASDIHHYLAHPEVR